MTERRIWRRSRARTRAVCGASFARRSRDADCCFGAVYEKNLRYIRSNRRRPEGGARETSFFNVIWPVIRVSRWISSKMGSSLIYSAFISSSSSTDRGSPFFLWRASKLSSRVNRSSSRGKVHLIASFTRGFERCAQESECFAPREVLDRSGSRERRLIARPPMRSAGGRDQPTAGSVSREASKRRARGESPVNGAREPGQIRCRLVFRMVMRLRAPAVIENRASVAGKTFLDARRRPGGAPLSPLFFSCSVAEIELRRKFRRRLP